MFRIFAKNRKMIEIIKHTLGLCGEGHPSLLCMLGLGPMFFMLKTYIKNIFFKVYIFIKFGLKRVYTYLRCI